jgi:hypothetical protein
MPGYAEVRVEKRFSLPYIRMLIFAALSFADLYLTRELLVRGHGQIYESNPIADAWLSRYGMDGLVYFKMGALSVVGGVAVFLSTYRPRAGRWLLNFGCLVVGSVALYSCLLMSRLAEEEIRSRERLGPAPVHPGEIRNRLGRS